MNIIPIVLIIFGINFIIASDDWVTVDDFSASELANLTLQQEHELMLQKLVTKKELIVARMMYCEVLSIGFGYYFIGLSQNENSAQENNAIIWAMFECLKSLLIQDRVEELLLKIPLNGAQYARTYGNVSLAFSFICSDIDMVLKNETLYTTLRDKYRNESYSQPKHYYLNRIPKSSKEVITASEKLFGEPKMKQVVAHRSWVSMKFSTNSKLTDIQNSIRKLARVQDKSKEVQKYYEQWIEEIIPMMRNTSMDTNGPSDRYWYSIYFPLDLIDRLWNSIIRNVDDWMDYLECRPTADDDFSTDENTFHLRKRCRRMGVIEDPTHNNIWPVTSDFNPLHLANKTLQQSHDLFLNELVKKKFLLKGTFIFWEILAKSIGNDFFGLIKDEKVNIRCNSIIKAVFDCIPSLQLQGKAMKTISMARKIQSELKDEDTSDISQEFIRTCTNLGNLMENETFYNSKRDKYMKQNLSAPKKTYQYSIGNPSEDQRKIIAELLNDPLLKKFWAHVQWMGIDSNFRYFGERKTKHAILALAKVPNKLTAVQRIYEQSVDELISFVEDFSSDNIFQAVDSPPNSAYFGRLEFPSDDFPSLIIKQIVLKINKNADLVNIFKALNEPPA